MKSLVIGATGYIGIVVAERLLQTGRTVIGVARSAEGAEKLRKLGIEPLTASLEQPDTLIGKIKDVDEVIYVAYGYHVEAAAVKELEQGTSHLTEILQSMFNTNKTFVLTSGSGVYPETGDIVYDEEMPFPPTDSPITLARRKLESEVIEAGQRGFRTIVLRPPTVYGRAGSFVVPRTLLEHATEKRESVYVAGTQNKKWSTVDVDDLADLFVLALEKAPSGSLYNTASESGITVQALAEAISRAAGLGGKTKPISLDEAIEIFGHWGEWITFNNQCSGEKARRELGWKPHRKSMLEEIEHGSYATLAARR
jgi:nucleoside-diphosphate-sugar epimerase